MRHEVSDDDLLAELKMAHPMSCVYDIIYSFHLLFDKATRSYLTIHVGGSEIYEIVGRSVKSTDSMMDWR